MAFKNHGILLLSDIKHELKEIDEEEYNQRLEIIIDEFSEALIYNSEDESFLNILGTLCYRLGYYRVARLCYETIIMSPSRLQDIFESFRTSRYTTPQEVQTLQSLHEICLKIKDFYTIDSKPDIFERLSRLQLPEPLAAQQRNSLSFITPTPLSDLTESKIIYPSAINLQSADWVSLIQALQDHVINLTQTKNKRRITSEDPYQSSTHSSNLVSFNLSDTEISEIEGKLREISPTPMDIDEEKPNTLPSTKLISPETEGENGIQDSRKPRSVSGTPDNIKANSDSPANISDNSRADINSTDDTSSKESSSSPVVENAPNGDATSASVDKKKRRKSENGTVEIQRSRSSKRFKSRTEEKPSLCDVDFSEDELFFDQISSFLKPCRFSFQTVCKVFLGDNYPASDLYLADFKKELENWGPTQVEILSIIKAEIASSSGSKSNSLSQPVLTQLLDGSTSVLSLPESNRPSKISPSLSSLEFVRFVNKNKFHIQEVRVFVARKLLGVQTLENEIIYSPILTETWPLGAIKSLGHLVEHCEALLLEYPKSLICQLEINDDSEMVLNELGIVQTVLEIIANEFLGVSKTLRKPETLTRLSAKEFETKKIILEDRYFNWRRIFNDLLSITPENLNGVNNIILRNQWTNLLVSRSNVDNPWNNGDDFAEVIKDLEMIDPNLEVSYSNFVNIPTFSLNSIRNQLSRFRAMSTLSEIFKDPLIELRKEFELENQKRKLEKEKEKEREKTNQEPKGGKGKNRSKNDKDKDKDRSERNKEREEERKRKDKLEKEFQENLAIERKKQEDELLIKTSKNRIILLERILLGQGPNPDSQPLFSTTSAQTQQDSNSSPSQSDQEYRAISLYLSRAPLDLRLKFWNLLLQDYRNVDEKQKSLDGYLSIFCDIVNEISTSKYRSLPQDQRQIVLLRSIYMCFDNTQNLMSLNLRPEDFSHISVDMKRKAMTSTIALLRMLHVYVLYEDAIMNTVISAPTHPAWEKSTEIIKGLIVRTWCLFYLLFRSLLPTEECAPEVLNDALSIIHEQLGTRGYCGLADGVLLDMILNELLGIKFEESEADIIQCLSCRYNMVISNEDFHPYDHETTPINIDKDTALRVLEFSMSIMLKRKNLAQSILRSEVKGALDELYDAIKFPDNVSTVSRNAFILYGIMGMNVDISFLQKCFKGGQPICFVNTPSEIDILSSTGFYFLLGQSRMSLFKVRKRTMPGHTEDVAEAIKFLKYDLMCGNYNRFETWFSLAQGYDALVEDDLTWNVDKIYIPEFRELTVNRQRKSLICCGIAVNQLLRNGPSPLFANTPTYQNLSQNVWVFFARILFNASQCPMDMSAFTQLGEKMLCGIDGLYTRIPSYQLRPKVILKTALLSLQVALKDQSSDWYIHYLKGQILHKLKSPAIQVLDTYCLSISNIPDKPGNHGEVILEPHYKLVSCIYKYINSEEIDIPTALKYLQKSTYMDTKIQINSSIKPENNELYSICISTLAKIRSSDKKKWHHRPTYRIAKIYDETGDYVKAKEEMSTFFLLKANSKIPIQIWKTEYERPGQHFEYVRRYIEYFVTLLGRTLDIEAFGFLSKCLRKFKSGMLRHQETWEFMCTTVAKMLKEILDIPTKYADREILRLVHDEFTRTTAKLLTYNEDPSTPLHPMTKFLNYTAELRRLNNGFGSTAALDDVFVSLYLIIYNDFVSTVVVPEEEELKRKEKEEKNRIAQTPKTPHQTSRKISVMDLLSDPVTPTPEQVMTPPPKPKASTGKSGKGAHGPSSSKKTPPSSANKGGSAVKVRVTRREIISRSLALLRSALAKLIASDSMKITKANTPIPSRDITRRSSPAVTTESSEALQPDNIPYSSSPLPEKASKPSKVPYKSSISSLLDPEPEPEPELETETEGDNNNHEESDIELKSESRYNEEKNIGQQDTSQSRSSNYRKKSDLKRLLIHDSSDDYNECSTPTPKYGQPKKRPRMKDSFDNIISNNEDEEMTNVASKQESLQSNGSTFDEREGENGRSVYPNIQNNENNTIYSSQNSEKNESFETPSNSNGNSNGFVNESTNSNQINNGSQNEEPERPKPRRNTGRHSDWFNTIIGSSNDEPIELD